MLSVTLSNFYPIVSITPLGQAISMCVYYICLSGMFVCVRVYVLPIESQPLTHLSQDLL